MSDSIQCRACNEPIGYHTQNYMENKVEDACYQVIEGTMYGDTFEEVSDEKYYLCSECNPFMD